MERLSHSSPSVYEGDANFVPSERTPLWNRHTTACSNSVSSSLLLRLRLMTALICLLMMGWMLWYFDPKRPWHPPIMAFSNNNEPVFSSRLCAHADDSAEIWLIRHGEKAHNINDINSMYDLSKLGWKRANYLSELVRTGRWPKFGALFATRYASNKEMQQAWPEVATRNGFSMVKREYQTLVPMAKVLNMTVNVDFAKDNVEGVAVAATLASRENCGTPVLISWDHCSLPTLTTRGFGCNYSTCQRCWADDRFDDVLILRVGMRKESSVVASALIKMTREYFDNGNSTIPSLELLNRAVESESTTPCAPSYCTDRPEAKELLKCACFDGKRWRPLQSD